MEPRLVDVGNRLTAPNAVVCVEELGARFLADLQWVRLTGDDDRRRAVDLVLHDDAGPPRRRLRVDTPLSQRAREDGVLALERPRRPRWFDLGFPERSQCFARIDEAVHPPTESVPDPALEVVGGSDGLEQTPTHLVGGDDLTDEGGEGDEGELVHVVRRSPCSPELIGRGEERRRARVHRDGVVVEPLFRGALGRRSWPLAR